MKITTAEEMRAIDRATTERYGVPSLTLMENAGMAVATFALREWPQAQRFVIVCGKGNNGGDGFVAARKLREAGREVTVVLLGHQDEVRGDAAAMLQQIGMPVVSVVTGDELRTGFIPQLHKSDLVIDAILGTGFRPPVTGLYAEAIAAINAAAVPVLAVDIPSGADSDFLKPQNESAGIARADAIVTFTAPRPAHVFGQLTRGPVVVAPIGSPDEAIVSDLNLNVIAPHDFAAVLATRALDGHKGIYGHALIVGGSIGKTGAAAMAGATALRAGAGLVTVATAKSALPMVAAFTPEIMTEPLAETDAGSISLGALEYGRFDAIVKGKSVIGLGPGISRHPDTVQFVRAAVARYKVPMVIDADGLNAFEGRTSELNGSTRPLVLTPHPGEMARLTGVSTAEVQADRLGIARKFAREHNLVVVLKGHRTLIAWPDGTVWVNPTGNPGMATGGTGDVLTGMLAGLMAQFDLRTAVLSGVYLHGLAGDIACGRMGESAMIAGDLITSLPEAFRRARQSAQEVPVRIG